MEPIYPAEFNFSSRHICSNFLRFIQELVVCVYVYDVFHKKKIDTHPIQYSENLLDLKKMLNKIMVD